MKKRISPTLMGAKGSHRSLMRGLLKSIFQYGKITTSHSNAKQLSRLIDRLIMRTKGKEPLVAKRYLLKQLADRDLAQKIWDYSQTAQKKRNSGFTSLLKLGPRRGDAHEQAIIELLDFVKKPVKEIKKVKEVKKNA
jgi:large subunit ribosomal protein L17